DDAGRRHQRTSGAPEPAGRDTKEPRAGPGSWIHVSRDGPRSIARAGGSKVRARLTGRTPRLPRAMAWILLRGLGPARPRKTARVYGLGWTGHASAERSVARRR